MVKHHVLIGLGFKRKNFKNRAIQYMIKRASPVISNFMGGALPQNQMTIMPVNRPLPKMGGVVVARRPLKFNY
jgi:hypothetical protein